VQYSQLSRFAVFSVPETDVFGTGEMWFGVITAKRELLYHPL